MKTATRNLGTTSTTSSASITTSTTSITPSKSTSTFSGESERSLRTRELFQRLSTLTDSHGDRVEAQRLRDEIVLLNLPVADALAHRYTSRGIATEDLVQVARLTLVKVVRTFSVTFDNDFLAYAVPSITGALRKHFRDAGWVVRPPRRLQEAQLRINAETPRLQQVLGRVPTGDELAEATGLEESVVAEALSLDGCFSPTSLDVPAQRDRSGTDTIGSLLPDDLSDLDFARAEARMALRPLVEGLSHRDRQVLELRFVHEMTQREVGDRIGVTQMQVSRILTRILNQLREQLSTPPMSAQLN